VSVCEELERQLSDPTYILATYYSCTSYLYTLYCSCLCSVLVLSSGDSIFYFLFWTDAKCHSREGSLDGVAIDQPSLSRHLRCVSFLYDISGSCIFATYFGCYRLESHTTDRDHIIRTNLQQQDSNDPKERLSRWTPYLRDWTPHSRWKSTTMPRVPEATRGYTTLMCSTT
jgi:hypothetical protein